MLDDMRKVSTIGRGITRVACVGDEPADTIGWKCGCQGTRCSPKLRTVASSPNDVAPSNNLSWAQAGSPEAFGGYSVQLGLRGMDGHDSQAPVAPALVDIRFFQGAPL